MGRVIEASEIRSLHILAACVGIVFTLLFLVSNIRIAGGGVGYAYLVAPVVCAAGIVVTRPNPIRAIIVPQSSAFLLAFLAYFLLRLLLDVPDFEEIKSYTIGTSGGLVFALLLGTTVSTLLVTLFERVTDDLSRTGLALGLLTVAIYLCIDTYLNHAASVRGDLFLIDASGPSYQRSGSFLIVLVLIASLLLVLATCKRERSGLAARTIRIITNLMFAVVVAVSLATSQLIGSNTAFVMILFLAIAIWMWIWRPTFHRLRWGSMLQGRQMDTVSMLRDAAAKFLVMGLGFVLLVVGFGVAVFSYTYLEPHHLRIFGFSDEQLGGNSFISRFRILSENFLTQFAYSPVFGNLNADTYTTGAGSYAHSLLSLFSHLGLVGAGLFVAYLVAIGLQSNKTDAMASPFFASADIRMFRLITLGGVLGFAIIGTYFTWMPLWFALGLLYPPMTWRNPGLLAIVNYSTVLVDRSQFAEPHTPA